MDKLFIFDRFKYLFKQFRSNDIIIRTAYRDSDENGYNYKFMTKSTFLLGAHLGILFAIYYCLELFLLFLNPYEVMSPSESRYLLYNALSQNAGVFRWKTLIYDFSCWILDRDKVIAYSLYCMWFVSFANILSRGSAVSFGGNNVQKKALSTLLGIHRKRYRILPFIINVIIAIIITIFACGAATSPFHENWTSLLRLFILDPLSWNLGFIAYRIAYPILFFICTLHIIIGIQAILLGGKIKRTVNRLRISNHFFIISQFIICLFGAEYLVLKFTMASTGSLDWAYFYENIYISIIGIFIGSTILLILLIYDPRPDNQIPEILQPPSNWLEFYKALKKLPKFSIIPMCFILLPMALYMFSIYDEAIVTFNKNDLTPYVDCLSNMVNRDLSKHENRKNKKTQTWIDFDENIKFKIALGGKYISIENIKEAFVTEKSDNKKTEQNSSP